MTFSFSTCRDEFTCDLEHGRSVKVIVGIPRPTQPYMTISYVWEDTANQSVCCQACRKTTNFPMSSIDKLIRILSITSIPSGSMIWLDALSIDQADHADIQRQVAVMGDIYSKADLVAVLLPASDLAMFNLLRQINEAATTLLWRKKYFDRNSEEPVLLPTTVGHSEGRDPQHEHDSAPVREPPMEGPPTSQICTTFFNGIDRLSSQVTESVYFSRAWTFQEWALATNVSVSHEVQVQTLVSVKKRAIVAALMIFEYKMQKGAYAGIDVGFSRGYVPTKLEQVKNFYIDEGIFISEDEVDDEKLAFQTLMPHFRYDQILRLQTNATPQTPTDKNKFRLRQMLNAFTYNKREAKYEADLVCCWASMCNIKYEYQKTDSFAVALQKVVTAIRRQGDRIYNFVVNTHADIDVCFLDYAAAHVQGNALNASRLPGTPLFTGVMDTGRHFQYAATKNMILADKLEVGETLIRLVTAAKIEAVTPLAQSQKVIDHFACFQPSHLAYVGSAEEIKQVLEGLSDEQKTTSFFVACAVPIEFTNTEIVDLNLWAVCRHGEGSGQLFIARESLNGTLVLMRRTNHRMNVVAYLCLTDSLTGSRLVPTDEKGNVNIKLNVRIRGDMVSGEDLSNRYITGRIGLAGEETCLDLGNAAAAGPQ